MPILTESALKLALPKMIKVRQKFDMHEIIDIEESVRKQLYKEEIKAIIEPGKKIALAVGSRGICNIARIVKTAVMCLQEMGAEPFIVPAMGSHGGATAEGQREVLNSFGINEETMGVPIRSSMEVVKIGETNEGIPVFMDKLAYQSDMVVLIARVKPHTDFKGKVESGLCKMMAIGLGKHEGCSRLHQEGFENFHTVIPEVAEVFLKNVPIGFGLAIVENAYDRTALIEAVLSKHIIEEDARLLLLAKKNMPRIMLPTVDVLIVEQIGKDITGAGMDPNIVGRTTKGKLPGFSGPDIQRIVVLGLSEGTHGNACGIGLADFTVKNVLDEIDHTATYANVIASGNPEAGRIPVAMESEREAVIAAVKCCTRIDENNPKIVRIKDTLHLGEIYVSENLLPIILENDNLEFAD
ncbi:MAG: hypothetical protein K0R84_560 [Clostridia bacterium]|nr:hypothetical protein [Clostridia bacterium]